MPKNIYEIAFKSIDILCEKVAEESIKQSDMIIDLELPNANVFNIKKIDYCYNIGYITTITKINEIKKMLKE